MHASVSLSVCTRFSSASVARPVQLWSRTGTRRTFPARNGASSSSAEGFRDGTTDAGDVTKAGQQRPSRLPQPISKIEQASVQVYLQAALGLDAAAARSLSRRTRSPSLISYANCQGWVAYLSQLASGDASVVSAILQREPQLLLRPCDPQRLARLQRSLSAALGVAPPALLAMILRAPRLLLSTPDTVTAAATFLLSQPGSDPAAVRQAVLRSPQILATPVSTTDAKLQWLTGTLGAATPAALDMLPALAGCAVAGALEPRRLWLLQQGFTPAQVLSMAQRHPQLLSAAAAVLQRRLDYFTQACGMPADAVQRLLTQQPRLWTRDLGGPLAQLKLQYWQQQLGYSLSDLDAVPIYLSLSLSRIASRHSTLRLLGQPAPSLSRFQAALISGSGAAPTHFGPRVFEAFIQRQLLSSSSGGGGGSSVQDILMPMAAHFTQADLRAEWVALLLARPPLAAAGPSTRQHHQLYAALESIPVREWSRSEDGLRWLAKEAAAKAEEQAALEAARRAARKQSPGEAGGGEAAPPPNAVPPAAPADAAPADQEQDGAPRRKADT